MKGGKGKKRKNTPYTSYYRVLWGGASPWYDDEEYRSTDPRTFKNLGGGRNSLVRGKGVGDDKGSRSGNGEGKKDDARGCERGGKARAFFGPNCLRDDVKTRAG